MTGPGIGFTINPSSDDGLLTEFAGLREFLHELAAVGYDHAELGARGLGVTIGGTAQPSRLAALRDALAGCPLRLTLHGSWFGSGRVGNLLDVGSAVAQRAALLADLELAAAIGAEVVVYHAGVLLDPYGDGDAFDAGMLAERRALSEIADTAGERGIVIAVENRAPTPAVLGRRSYGMRPDLVAEQVRRIDHPSVRMCFDTGHAYLAACYLRFDFLATVREIAPVVGHIHLSDNFGRMPPNPGADVHELEILGEGDLHLPPGWGTIPLADVLAVPYPMSPVVVIEMRHVRHHREAFARTRELMAARVAP